MYGVSVVTPPAGQPVEPAKLRARLRINDAAEDADLGEFIDAATEQFELDTGRPVLATGYRQDLARWPCGPIVLGRGGVVVVSGVEVYTSNGFTTTLSATQWRADLLTPPARVYLADTPPPVTTAAGIPVTPVGRVNYVAGWSDAAAVPRMVRRALMLLAGHFYEHREAYREGRLDELPEGWWAVVSRFKLGVSGDWGQ